jgi:mannose-6-phosphate isomerase-like protein (cupin superfamily)
MPSGNSEAKHMHQKSHQFFYILKGEATFETNCCKLTVTAGEGFHIPAGVPHKISNHMPEDLEFILCSQPSTIDDRINL